METLANSSIAVLAIMLAASAAVFAQNSGPNKTENPAKILDAREIVAVSVAARERSWRVRDHSTYTERDEDRRVDSLGQVKSENTSLTRMILVNNSRFEQLVEHNGQLPSAE